MVIILTVVAVIVVVTGALGALMAGRLVSNGIIGFGRAHSAPVQPNADKLTLSPGPVRQYPASVPGWKSGQPPTDAQLAQVDPLRLYWVVLKKQALEPTVENTFQFFQTVSHYQQGSGGAYQSSFDYRSKRFTFQDEDLRAGQAHGDLYRCIGLQPYNWSQFEKKWVPSPFNSGSANLCHRYQPDSTPVQNAFINDGTATGGLTTTEADRFISYLANQKGLFSAERPLLVSGSDGKPYIQLGVTLTPIPASPYGDRVGSLVLNSAFRETGKDPQTWPYDFVAGPGQGKKLTYYLDPATLLPTYSKVQLTPPLDRNGKPPSGETADAVVLTQYAFPGAIVPLTLNDHDPFPLSWPLAR